MKLVNSLAEITSAVKKCITNEMVENGLLNDVETFIPSYRLDEPMELPAIWLFEHPTIESDKKGSLSNLIYLKTPFEFVCIVYDEDLEQSEILGKNLAARVGHTILKNKNLITDDGRRIFNNVKFRTLYPAGEVQIDGKTNKTPATSIVLEIEYFVDWLKCNKI